MLVRENPDRKKSEQIWLNECHDEFKPVYFRRYVDDIFVLFCSPVYLEKFQNYSNAKHRNIRFTCEKEHNISMPFLDVLLPELAMVSKYLCITNPHLVEYIQISTVSFPNNIMLV